MADRTEAEGCNERALEEGAPEGAGTESGLSRLLLLECRLEGLEAAAKEARAEADEARERLAEAMAREARQARRICELQDELAQAHAEIVELWRRLDRTDALQARLVCPGPDGEATLDRGEALSLRRELLQTRQSSANKDRIINGLRRRLEDVFASRERLFSRVAEWQRVAREDGPEAVDLAEFIAELRAEILSLEVERNAGERREGALRDSLARVGLDPDAEHLGDEPQPKTSHEEPVDSADESSPSDSTNGSLAAVLEKERFSPASSRLGEGARPRDLLRKAGSEERSDAYGDPMIESLAAEVVRGDPSSRLRAGRRLLSRYGKTASAPLAAGVAAAEDPGLRAALLVLLGRTADQRAVGAVRPWLKAEQPLVRCAAYEAACRMLNGKGEDLIGYLRAGLSDSDPTVRRRAILSAATARGISPRPLLEPLKKDSDHKVRSLVRQVLAKLPPDDGREGEDAVLSMTLALGRAGGAT